MCFRLLVACATDRRLREGFLGSKRVWEARFIGICFLGAILCYSMGEVFEMEGVKGIVEIKIGGERDAEGKALPSLSGGSGDAGRGGSDAAHSNNHHSDGHQSSDHHAESASKEESNKLRHSDSHLSSGNDWKLRNIFCCLLLAVQFLAILPGSHPDAHKTTMAYFVARMIECVLFLVQDFILQIGVKSFEHNWDWYLKPEYREQYVKSDGGGGGNTGTLGDTNSSTSGIGIMRRDSYSGISDSVDADTYNSISETAAISNQGDRFKMFHHSSRLHPSNSAHPTTGSSSHPASPSEKIAAVDKMIQETNHNYNETLAERLALSLFLYDLIYHMAMIVLGSASVHVFEIFQAIATPDSGHYAPDNVG
jgi:hypothetical protein